jgi:hypothetical protein
MEKTGRVVSIFQTNKIVANEIDLNGNHSKILLLSLGIDDGEYKSQLYSPSYDVPSYSRIYLFFILFYFFIFLV